MTDADRGAYTPSTDAPLAFDARQPVRGARPVPFTLIISAVVLIALIAAVFIFYQGGVRQAGDAPQTVGAPVGDLRGAAPAETTTEDPAAGLQIYRTDAGEPSTGEPRFAPPPEQPAPRPEPIPAAAPTTPVAAQPVPLPAARPSPAVTATPPAPKPTVVAAAPKAPAPTAPTPKAAVPPPAPKVAVATPAPKAAAPAPKAAPGGAASVQIGAFNSRELAEAELGKVAGVSGNPGGRTIEPAPGTTLFRAKVTGFASRADAVAWCNQLKATGKQCIVR